MYKIMLTDEQLFNHGCIDEAETKRDANVLKDAYEEDYPKAEGYTVDIEHVSEKQEEG